MSKSTNTPTDEVTAATEALTPIRFIVVHHDESGNPFATRVLASDDDAARAILTAKFPSHSTHDVINEDGEHQQPADYRNDGTLSTIDIDRRRADASVIE